MELAHKLVSTRRGTLALAAIAAVTAGLLVLVYVNRYRNNLSSQNAVVSVLVANATIPKGTPGSVVASKGLYSLTTVRQGQLHEGAISDPTSLLGKAASKDVYGGEQLTASDFAASATGLASSLSADERLISIPIDASHGLIGELQAGDHVDIYVGFNVSPVGPTGTPTGGETRPVLRLAMQDVRVVSVGSPKGGIGGASGPGVSLRVNDSEAAKLAFASDNGKIWLVLRPSSGAKPSRLDIVTAETILLGVPPVAVLKSLGGR
jgi:Flp pilus assembly protein CpaB